MPEFTPLEALQVGKKASTAAGMKTVFAAESSLNIARRIRNAAVPLGCVVEDDAAVRDAARRAFGVKGGAVRAKSSKSGWILIYFDRFCMSKSGAVGPRPVTEPPAHATPTRLELRAEPPGSSLT